MCSGSRGRITERARVRELRSERVVFDGQLLLRQHTLGMACRAVRVHTCCLAESGESFLYGRAIGEPGATLLHSTTPTQSNQNHYQLLATSCCPELVLVNHDLVWTDQPQQSVGEYFPSHLLLPALVVGSKGVAPTAVLASCSHMKSNSPSL